jgi:hypothetical protein
VAVICFKALFRHISSDRTMALRFTQPPTEMSTRNISWGVKVAGAWNRQTYHLHVLIVLKSGYLNLLEPYGPVQTCNGIDLPLHLPPCIRSDWRKPRQHSVRMVPKMETKISRIRISNATMRLPSCVICTVSVNVCSVS